MFYPRSSWLGTLALLLGAAIFFSSCALIEPTREVEEEPAEEEVALVLADYEDFDVSQYEEELPMMQIEVEHEVPSQLLEGRAGAGTERVVQGWRVQIYSTESRVTADEYVLEVMDWWHREREDGALDEIYQGAVPQEPPVYLIYRQPYFRIRVGDFVSQDTALALRDLLREEFSGAFISQSPVTVVR